MNICFHSTNSDSYCYIAATDRLCRCYFCKLNILLCLGHFKQPPLPFVVGLLTDAVLPAPGLDVLAAAAALRNTPCPQCQFVLAVVFFVKYFSLKKASEFPFFSKGFSLPSAGIMHPCA